jgi:cysteine peptidase C11 family protein
MSDRTSKSRGGAQNQQAAQQNGGAKPPQNGNMKTWTIIIDMAADSALANFAIESLKQLNATANEKVKVAVQFSIDAPGGQKIPRYIFDAPSQAPISASLDSFLDAPKDMTQLEALASLVHWAFYELKKKGKDLKADYYALILWGHGPELLLQPPSSRISNTPCGDPGEDNNGLFLNPIELREALEIGLSPDFRASAAFQRQASSGSSSKSKIDVIAFDACSMALFEVAYEIQKIQDNKIDFMIASQEEVPDLSFPYDRLVQDILKYMEDPKADPAGLCRNLVNIYGVAYRDYICNSNTGMKKVTLSAIRLQKLGDLEKALADLANFLLDARCEPGLPDLLLDCRARAKGFAGGLYVDIFNFCDKLRAALQVPPIPEGIAKKISDACADVCNALLLPDDDGHNEEYCILANQANDTCDCHGLSIYFPYMRDDEVEQTRQPLVKGGTDTVGKGFSGIMNRAASNVLMCVRREMIIDTEAYYANLALAIATNWYEFIVKVWTPILILRLPSELDLRYSAQQAAVNMLKNVVCRDTLPPKNPVEKTGAGLKPKRIIAAKGQRR